MHNISILDAADARRLVDAAIDAARGMSVPQNIVVVDAAGDLLLVHRMDGAKPFTIDFAVAKARTAAGTHARTDDLADIAQPGERGFGVNTLKSGSVAILGGGIPIYHEGTVVGAIGVSSGSVGQDIEVAEAAVAAFAS